MVTLNEILGDLFRYFITFISGLYVLLLVFFLILRLVVGNRLWFIAAINNFTPYCFTPLLLLIVLAIIARAKWGLIPALAALGIGVVMFVGFFIPRNLPAATGPTLQVATLNVYSGNTTIGRVINWVKNSDSDVVLLQEVPDNFLLNLTYQLGAQYPHISVRQATQGQISVLMLSRYPILLVHDEIQATTQSANVEVRYVIDWNGQNIVIHNIDLAIPTGKERFKIPLLGQWFSQLVLAYDDVPRNEQIHNLLGRLETEKLPFIVAGNFAMADQAFIYPEITKVMGDSFRETSTGFGGSWPVQEVVGVLPNFVPPLFRIDYIWHSSQFRAVSSKQGGYLGSDHLPLEAELEMLPSA